jgi:hypothetical protein
MVKLNVTRKSDVNNYSMTIKYLDICAKLLPEKFEWKTDDPDSEIIFPPRRVFLE